MIIKQNAIFIQNIFIKFQGKGLIIEISLALHERELINPILIGEGGKNYLRKVFG